MHVRLATIADVPAILDLSNHYALATPANFSIGPEPLADWMRSFEQTSAMHPWLVAKEGDGGGTPSNIFGFAKASPWKGRCAYNWSAEVTVYVHEHLQRRGVGRALYSRLIEILREQGYRTLLGGITQPNDASVRLHESLGFRQVALLKRVGYKFDRWWDVGYWELILDESPEPPQSIKPVSQVVSGAA